jgi:hypothetical protein
MGFIIFSWSSSGKAVDEKIARRIQMEKETHKAGNRLRKQFSQEVIELLQDVAIKACADRALVFEYSNGTSNLAGLPFLFASAAAEVTSAGTSPVALQYQKINLSLVSKFLSGLEKEGYVYIEDLESVKEEYPVMYAFMKPNNVKSALFYAIHGVDEVVGFIVATTIHDRILCKKDSLHEVAKAAQIISSM